MALPPKTLLQPVDGASDKEKNDKSVLSCIYKVRDSRLLSLAPATLYF